MATKLQAVVACTYNNVIGLNNELPWHLPEDLKHFKRVTIDKPVIMGRTTFEVLGKPLPRRRNIVLTNQPNYQAEGAEVVHSKEEALAAVANEPEASIIGGASIYTLFLPETDQLWLSRIHTYTKGDTFFPEVDAQQWKLAENTFFAADNHNKYPISFQRFVRVEE